MPNFFRKYFFIQLRSWLLLAFLLLGIAQNVEAQKYTMYQDSLIRLLELEQNQTERLDTYFELVDDLYLDSSEKEGDLFYGQMEKFVVKRELEVGTAYLSILKSYKAFFIKNDISNAIIYGIEGTEALKSIANISFAAQKNLSVAIEELGYFYENAGMYDKALQAYLEALDLSKRYKYKPGEMTIYNRLFFLHSEYFNDDELGIRYLEKALKTAREIEDTQFTGTLKGNLAMLYIKIGDFEKGDLLLEKAISMRIALKDTVGLAHTYLEKSRLYFKQNDFKKALINIEKCLAFAPEKCDWCYKIQITKGQIAKAEGNYTAAEKAFLEAEDLIKLAPNLSKKYTILIHLAGLAKDRNEIKKAADYYAKAFEVKEKLDNQWTVGNAMKIEIQSKIAKVEAEKRVLHAEKELLATKFNLQRKVFFLMILLLFLAIASAVFIFLQKRKLLKTYHILVQKNRALTRESLKKEVEDSQSVLEEMSDKKPISNELEIALLKKVEKALESDKIFLDKTLTLAIFAQLLDTNTTYLSKIINNHYKKRFSTLINEYRIKEILLYFESDRLKDLTIFALAQEAGFNSKSAFNNAFKEYAGVTPTFYLKNIENN